MIGLLLPSLAMAAPEDDGAFGVVVTNDVMVPVSGAQLATDVYVPDGGGARPLVVLRHGFGRSKTNFTNWGHHLASRGLIVLVPNARSLTPDAAQDSDDMLAVLAWAVAQNGQAGSPLAGRVDGSRRAVAGHSAGGLAAVVAASKDAALSAAVLLDPVEGMSGTPGATAAAATHVPTVAIFAEPASCNDNGSGVAMFRALAGPHYGLRTSGATHCDPENPSDSLCANFCGGAATPARQAEFSRYATAFLLAYLICDAPSLPYVDGPAAAADTMVVRLPETTALAPCPAGVDAGAGADSGVTDAAVTPDGSRPDGSSAGGPGSAQPTGASSGCACALGETEEPGISLAAIGLAALLIVRAVRR